MKEIILCFVLMFSTPSARGDMFGGDVVVLAKILANAIVQLEKLRQILQAGSSQLELLRQVNQGLDQTLRLIQIVDPNFKPGIYRSWQDLNVAIREIERIYGDIANTRDKIVQGDVDRNIAEAFSNNGSIYRYAQTTQDYGDSLHRQSRAANPKSAQRLTAQSVGVVVGQMSQSLRTQATSIKLQAQAMAVQNRKDKMQSKQVQNAQVHLSSALKSYQPQFKIPKL